MNIWYAAHIFLWSQHLHPRPWRLPCLWTKTKSSAEESWHVITLHCDHAHTHTHTLTHTHTHTHTHTYTHLIARKYCLMSFWCCSWSEMPFGGSFCPSKNARPTSSANFCGPFIISSLLTFSGTCVVAILASLNCSQF